jgi:hypothetical protein
MITLASGWAEGKFHANNMVIYRLWERHNYYYAVEHFDKIYQRHLPTHTTMEAKQIAFDEHAREIQEAQVRGESQITSLAIIREALKQILKRGLRWMALVNAFESEEILLLDQDAPLFENSTLGDVLLDCSDDDFEWMKGFLLLPENGLKNTCYRLSGISNMLKDLSDTGHDSPVRTWKLKLRGGSRTPFRKLRALQTSAAKWRSARCVTVRLWTSSESDQELWMVRPPMTSKSSNCKRQTRWVSRYRSGRKPAVTELI